MGGISVSLKPAMDAAAAAQATANAAIPRNVGLGVGCLAVLYSVNNLVVPDEVVSGVYLREVYWSTTGAAYGVGNSALPGSWRQRFSSIVAVSGLCFEFERIA